MKIYQTKHGEISENPIWCCFCDEFVYTADTLEELVEVLNTEWQQDKHIAVSGW